MTTWLLLEGNRLVIAAAVVLAIFLALVAILWAYGVDSLDPQSPVYFLFGSLLTGNLTLLTVVLSINQLVLSRELGAPGTLQERVTGTLSYRHEVETTADAGVPPNTPPEFLRYLHDDVEATIESLDRRAGDVREGDLRRRIDDLTDALAGDVETVDRALARDSGQIFTVVSATLATSHADQLDEIARIEAEYGDSLGDALVEDLDRLEDRLLQIAVARKYFKTVYVQKELAYLSRVLLYVGVPAIVAAGVALVFYNVVTITAVSEGVFLAVIVVAFTLGFAPLAILFSFVLRLAWVAQQTATVVPFSSQPEYRP